jgi:hypothetical protein
VGPPGAAHSRGPPGILIRIVGALVRVRWVVPLLALVAAACGIDGGGRAVSAGSSDGGPVGAEDRDGGGRTACAGSSDSWCPVSASGAPDARAGHMAVWTGRALLIWGGSVVDAAGSWGLATTGARYDVSLDQWVATSTVGAPRGDFHAVWTGQELIVWGLASEPPDTDVSWTAPSMGARYDPDADVWTPISSVGAPARRFWPTLVWTGSEMIVWGGAQYFSVDTGARYDPVADAWTPVTSAGAPEARHLHTAVWTGERMVVWGGLTVGPSGYERWQETGALYDPATDTFSPTAVVGAPEGRADHTAVWTGTEMVVWGGDRRETCCATLPTGVATGGKYDPTLDRWSPMATEGAPSARAGHTAIWTGEDMLVWGGDSTPAEAFGLRGDGGRYDPQLDAWRPLSSSDAPAPRYAHTAVWTGAEMIVWGGASDGVGSTDLRADGARYFP